MSKLDKSVAHDYVRMRYAQGATQATIGRELGVTQQAVSKIMRVISLTSRGPGRTPANAGGDATRAPRMLLLKALARSLGARVVDPDEIQL
jgi:transcriptional regulator with XRE-family HTH domain